jgi:predicted PurR-regulated permease PerM
MKKTFDWCRRYISVTFLILVAFVVIVLFFNENSFLKSVEYTSRINELREEIKENEDTLHYYQQLNHALDTDPETMERIVRENYHMQHENEDVYIVK